MTLVGGFQTSAVATLPFDLAAACSGTKASSHSVRLCAGIKTETLMRAETSPRRCSELSCLSDELPGEAKEEHLLRGLRRRRARLARVRGASGRWPFAGDVGRSLQEYATRLSESSGASSFAQVGVSRTITRAHQPPFWGSWCRLISTPASSSLPGSS